MIARRGCVSKWFATDSNASYKFVRRQTTDNILLVVVVETWRIAGGHKEQSIDRAGSWSGDVAFVSRLLFPLPPLSRRPLSPLEAKILPFSRSFRQQCSGRTTSKTKAR